MINQRSKRELLETQQPRYIKASRNKTEIVEEFMISNQMILMKRRFPT
jgi:hypothetical protein